MVARPKKFGKEICALPKRKGRSGAYAQARHSGAALCPSGQDSAMSRFGTPGQGSGRQPHTCRLCSARASTWGERLLIKGESVIFARYTASRQMPTLHPPLLRPTWTTPASPLQADARGNLRRRPFPLENRNTQPSTVTGRDLLRGVRSLPRSLR